MPLARSFLARAEIAHRAARALAEAMAGVERPAGALVFASGGLADRLDELATVFDHNPPGVPLMLVAGSGVLSDKGEIEGDSAVSGLVWSGGEVDAFVIGADEQGTGLVEGLRRRGADGPRGATLLFAEPHEFAAETLRQLGDFERLTVLGAGGRAKSPVIAVDPNGKVHRGAVGALLLRGSYGSLVRASPAARLLMPFRAVTEVQGNLLLTIEGEPALEVLRAAASGLRDQPLVLAAIASDDAPSETDGRPSFLVRSVSGVDPDRGGVALNETARVGMRVAFAVRDASAARRDFESLTRELSRETAGGAPQFGVLLSCAGRGAGLYGAPDIDVRLLRTRFPHMPFAGLHSSFEIAPCGGRPALQLYAGVVGIFTVPS